MVPRLPRRHENADAGRGAPALDPFEAAVLHDALERRLLDPRSRVLAAVSGGPDSTALLAALAALRDAGAIASVHACHVDHRLRAGSAADGDFCAQLCARLAVALERVAVDVGRGNVQAAARRARYAALRAAAAGAGADAIATGHTRGDQAETLLLRAMRGAGARGLAGIPPRRGALVRPLLGRSRAELLAYLARRGLGWRDDPTNATPRYLRNRVRAELLPLLERLAPGVEARLARSADLLRDDDRLLERLARALAPRGATSAPAGPLAAAPRPVRRRAVRRLFRAAARARCDLGLAHVDAVLRLLRARRPARAALPRGLVAEVAYGKLTIGAPAGDPQAVAPVAIPVPGTYPVAGRGLLEVACDGPGPTWPLVLRHRLPGDRFSPERGRGTKKLKGWLIDRKVPRAARDALLLLADAEGRVVYLVDLERRGTGAGALTARLLPA